MPRAFLIKNKVRCAAPLTAQPGVCVQEAGLHRGAQEESQEMGDPEQIMILTERPLKPLHLLPVQDVPPILEDRRASFTPPEGAGGGARLDEDPDPGDPAPRTTPVRSNPGGPHSGPQSPTNTDQPPIQEQMDTSDVHSKNVKIIEIIPPVEMLDRIERRVPKYADEGEGELGSTDKSSSKADSSGEEVHNGGSTNAENISALEKLPPFKSPGGGNEGSLIPMHPSWVWWERAWSDLHGARRQFLQGGQIPTLPGAALHPTPPVPAAASSAPSCWVALPEAMRTRPEVVRRQEGSNERAPKVGAADSVTERCSIPSLPCRPQVFRPSPGRLAPPHGPPQVWGGMSSMVGGLLPPHHLLSLPTPHLAALQTYYPALGPPHTGALDPSALVKFHSDLSRAEELKLSRDPGGFSMSGLERITSSLFSFNDRESKTNSNSKPDSSRNQVLNEGVRNSSANKIEPRPKELQPRQNQPWRSVTTEKVVAAGERRSTSEGQGRDLSQNGQGHDPLSRLKLEYGSRGEQEAPRRTMNPPRYQCEACNKSYATFSGLSKHKQFHCVSQVRKQFSCKYCDKMYVSLGALKMHIRTHTLPCKCQLCGKAFSRPWLLQGHVRTHTGEKPFQCAHCGRSFADRSNLRAHLQTHTDIKKYNCQVCSKTFSRMSLLLKHQDGGCPGSL